MCVMGSDGAVGLDGPVAMVQTNPAGTGAGGEGGVLRAVGLAEEAGGWWAGLTGAGQICSAVACEQAEKHKAEQAGCRGSSTSTTGGTIRMPHNPN